MAPCLKKDSECVSSIGSFEGTELKCECDIKESLGPLNVKQFLFKT
jgi:hypothetical protein